LSQLSDISEGVSMSSSLNNVIDESSFLTELRHNLTHKANIKGKILQMGKEIIIK
jgi:hypothetical protein